MDIKHIIKTLMGNGRLVDFFWLSRYMYSVGAPLIKDERYGELFELLASRGLIDDFINRTYDDDPIPTDLIKEFGLDSYAYDDTFEGEDMTYYQELNADKSLSIKAVKHMKEVWAYAQEVNVRNKRSVLGLKADGIFSKRKFVDGGLRLALSRGRTGNAWPMTNQIVLVEPAEVPTKEPLVIYSEGFCYEGALDYLSEKYDPERYKTPKSSAISMMRRLKDKEDYQFVKFLTFGVDGLSDSLAESYKILGDLGFSVVPHIVIEPGEVPETYEEFIPWMVKQLDWIWDASMQYPSDGVVWDLDSKTEVSEINGIYASRNIAIKLAQWSSQYYPAVIEEILDGHEYQSRVNKSCKVRIEPKVTNDRTQAKIINCYNPSILIRHGLTAGSRLYFKRDSGAVNLLVHGEELLSLDLGSAES